MIGALWIAVLVLAMTVAVLLRDLLVAMRAVREVSQSALETSQNFNRFGAAQLETNRILGERIKLLNQRLDYLQVQA